jgi:hypothetical protein
MVGGRLAKKKGLAERMAQDDEDLLENKDMFMSVKDFQDRMVVLPELGQKKGAGGTGPDVKEPPPEEEDEEEAEGEDTEEEGGEADDGEEGEEEGGEEEEGEEGMDEKTCNRECYQFNPKMTPELDDKCCKHCRLYLTLQCPHIKEFMDEVDEGDVD